MKAIDLFAGAGGFSVGLKRAGFEVAFANDIDADMCASHEANHPETVVYEGDITSLSPQDILSVASLKAGEVEVLVGGPPCQGFSTVGAKRESDPRNKLFVHFFRIVAALHPQVVVFENVSGFKRMYGGRAFNAVCQEFGELGYEVESTILNALNYGVPQHRLRTFVVGCRNGLGFSWPHPTHGDEKDLLSGDLRKPLTLEDALSDLPVIGPDEKSDSYAGPPRNEYQRVRRGSCRELTEHESPKHGPKLLKVIRMVPPGGCILDVPEQYRPKSYFANTYARLWWDRPSTTVTRNLGTPSSSRCIHPLADRGLTTREGTRLQSFDDDYIFVGSRASKNLQIGNAVPPLLAEAICRQLVESLSGTRESSCARGKARTIG